MAPDKEDKVEVITSFAPDQFEFLQGIANSLRIGVDQIVENAVISSIIGSAYPKDEARLQYVTAQARIDRWRRIQAEAAGEASQ